MKLRTVGLLVLAAAHLGASALPSVCLKNFSKAARNLEAEVNRLSIQAAAVNTVGIGGSLVGTSICAFNAKSFTGLIACPLIFVAIGYVAYQYAENLNGEILRLGQTATINEIYRDFRDSGAPTELEILTLAKVGASSARDADVASEWIKAMEDGMFCDSRGRPNKSVDEVLQIVKQRLN
jgi:hypothetical protein